MILKRKIYKKLLEWKNDSQGKRALLVEGRGALESRPSVKNLGKMNMKVIF